MAGNGMITSTELMTGDLLFMNHLSCSVSQAIDLVTQTGKNTHFSHIGIVEISDNSVKVYHSTPSAGVCCENLDQFLHPDEKETEVTVYRLKKEYLSFIPQAIKSAREFLGEAYNHSFQLTSPGYYCSELIFRIFAPVQIFDLFPMTFKDREKKEFPPHWIEYYRQLGISIPENQPGCNPNGMAASDKIQWVGELKF